MDERTPEEVVRDHAPKEADGAPDCDGTAARATGKDGAANAAETGEAAKTAMASNMAGKGEALKAASAPGDGPADAVEAGADMADGETEAVGADEEVTDGQDGMGDQEGKEKKKGFKKKPKKDKKDEKIEELNDRLVRNLAEFENFRNRSEKEKSARFDMGAKSVIEKFLPVVDNLERGFDGLSEDEKETPFVKGIEAIYKQLQTAFEELGVTPIEAVGQEFDPNLHNAVMHDEDDSEDTNKVVEEFQKGYLYKDSVVRHSMVKVLN